jgi:hypothetical protein
MLAKPLVGLALGRRPYEGPSPIYFFKATARRSLASHPAAKPSSSVKGGAGLTSGGRAEFITVKAKPASHPAAEPSSSVKGEAASHPAAEPSSSKAKPASHPAAEPSTPTLSDPKQHPHGYSKQRPARLSATRPGKIPHRFLFTDSNKRFKFSFECLLKTWPASKRAPA